VGSNCAWTTCTEIGGKFAGTVTGWMNFWGNAIGGVSPLIIAWFVMHYGWRAAILVTAASGISGTILWIFVRPNSPIRHRYSEPAQAAVVAAK
jgi:ACS family glucarate transporter-like MFS transporter